MRNATRLFGALASLLLALTLVGPASTAPVAAGPRCEPVRGVVMFGDSMTVIARDWIKARRPRWRIDGLRSRPVAELPARIDAYLDGRPPPRVAVIALGTNESEGWSKRDYRLATKLFPRRTRVVFVNTWRPLRTDSDGTTYSRWMREIAATRPRTTVANWRRAAREDPSLLDDDGIHQTRSGVRVWGRLALDAVAGAERAGQRADRLAGCR